MDASGEELLLYSIRHSRTCLFCAPELRRVRVDLKRGVVNQHLIWYCPEHVGAYREARQHFAALRRKGVDGGSDSQHLQ